MDEGQLIARIERNKATEFAFGLWNLAAGRLETCGHSLTATATIEFRRATDMSERGITSLGRTDKGPLYRALSEVRT